MKEMYITYSSLVATDVRKLCTATGPLKRTHPVFMSKGEMKKPYGHSAAAEREFSVFITVQFVQIVRSRS